MLKKYPIALYITWFVLLLLMPLPLLIMLNTSLVDSIRNLLIYDFGLVAYVWWLAIVYLSTRPQWLDRLIGLPAMYFIHGMLGVVALCAAFIHREFSFSMHEIISMTGDWAWYLAVFGILYAIFFMSGWLVDRFPITYSLKERLQFFFKHELSLWIHRIQFVMLFLVWLHVHVINRLAILTPFMMLLDLYTVYFISSYVWKKYVADVNEVIKGELIRNNKLSPTTQELKIKVSKDHRYLAGDFYFISFNSAVISKEKHPFSVISSPSQDGNILSFIIRSVGDFTENIPKIPLGTKITLEGPYGHFDKIVEASEENVPLVLYGLGTGIAPLKSMMLEYSTRREVHLIWSVKDASEHYFDTEFKQLSQEYPNIIYHSRVHRFSYQELSQILSAKEIEKGLYFVVGSARALLKVENTLKKLGVPERHIHDERLTM